MENNDFRAKQFLPFDALKGFYDAIGQKNILKQDKKVLSEDTFKELNNKINKIKKGDTVQIKYYLGFDYVKIAGVIERIDKVYKKIYISNSIIDVDDIIDIELI